jgi:hypothetical protein
MRTTTTIPASKLAQFQDLVKVHDLRFVGNPTIYKDRARVCIDSDHLPPGGCNQFWNDWQRMTTPIRETQAANWKRLFRRFGFKL